MSSSIENANVERHTYSTTILQQKSPLESIELVKLRLNESRLINSSLIDFLQEYLKVEEAHLAQLNRLLVKSSKVFEDPARFDPQLETLGLFSPIWNSFVGELHTELKCVDIKTKTLNLDVLAKLAHFEKKYKGNSENLNNLRKLSYRMEKLRANGSLNAEQLAELDGLAREWEARVPSFVEIVENYDFNRFILLKDVFLSLQSTNQDTLPQLTKQTEKSLEFVLNFDPDEEIRRFADEVCSKSLTFDQADLKDIASPVKHQKSPSKHHSFMGIGSNGHSGSPQRANRQPSMASTATTATDNSLMHNGFTSAPAATGKKPLVKEKSKLKSRVGSIFGKKKKDRKSRGAATVNEPIAESPMTSANTSRSSLPLDSRRRSSAATSELYQPLRGAAEPLPSAAAPVAAAEPQKSVSEPLPPALPVLNSRLSATTQPLTPSSPSKAHAELSRSGEHGSGEYGSGEYFSAESGASASAAGATAGNSATSHPHPPPVPLARGSHGAAPPVPVPRGRRDINSTLFVGLDPIKDGVLSPVSPPGYQQDQHDTASTIHRQATGSSFLQRQGTGTLPSSSFNHPDLVHPGLNSSIAEVVNATFKDNQFVRGNVVSELLLSYILGLGNGSEAVEKTPTTIRLSFTELAKLGKLLVNNQFLRQVSETEFEIFDVSAIHLKTVGALKYTYPLTLDSACALVSVLPVWRFEPHQASVVISIKPTAQLLLRLGADGTLVLSNLIVSVQITDAHASSAATRPTGSFNKDKNRITWVFKGPVELSGAKEERIIARFATDGVARESDHGVQVKFTVHDEDGAGLVSAPVQLHSKNLYSIDPFEADAEALEDDWRLTPNVKTLIAGKYEGHS